MGVKRAVQNNAPFAAASQPPAGSLSCSEPPDLPMTSATPRPLDLPRLVMRRAAWVALGAWLLVLALGLQRAGVDMEQEVAAAQTMAMLVASLAQPSERSDAQRLAELQRIVRGAPTRHLSLSVRDAEDRVVFTSGDDEPLTAPLSWLVALHRALLPAHEPAPVSWPLLRSAGPPWTVRIVVSHDSERAEAVANLAAVLGMAALGSVALLLAMAWNVRRSFTPMHALLQAIAALREGNAQALRALPTMPNRELQAIAAALRELADALDSAEAHRRALSQQVVTLQDDERQRIARELHDEFGQRLTALRADAAWLSRRLAGDATASRVVQAMAAQCEALQSEIRTLLRRLQPAADEASGASHLLRLQRQLEGLVQAWVASPGPAVRFELALAARDSSGRALPWPDPESARALALPRELAQALYRISQEALTNVARHAQASQAVLQLTLQRRADGDVLHWQVRDDGRGLGDWVGAVQRGNGLAGLRQRVWALGADLECDGARGVCLRASFRINTMPGWGAMDVRAAA
jgi:two-component system sensor histidine kinase UhpB